MYLDVSARKRLYFLILLQRKPFLLLLLLLLDLLRLVFSVATPGSGFLAFLGDGFGWLAGSGVTFLQRQTACTLIGGSVAFRPGALGVTAYFVPLFAFGSAAV